MGVSVQRGGKSESPFHFQAAEIGGGEPGLRRRSESACSADSGPSRSTRGAGRWIAEIGRGRGAHGGRRGRGVHGMGEGLAGDELGDGAAVGGRAAGWPSRSWGPDSMAASTRSGDMACRASWVGARSTPDVVAGRAASLVDGWRRLARKPASDRARARHVRAARKAEISYRDGFYHVDALEPPFPPQVTCHQPLPSLFKSLRLLPKGFPYYCRCT